MPLLFVGHGSPMFAIEQNAFTEGWRKSVDNVPRPKAILVVSAHWETRGTFVTAQREPRTIHDFRGFPKALFDVQYPAPGSPETAKTISESVSKFPVGLDESWGLDHGSWTILIHQYPNADVPVLQLSLDHTKPAAWHYEFAKELKYLREKGVLIIGSGVLVHNLRQMNLRLKTGFDWAVEANETFKKLILSGEHDKLIRYETLGKAVQMAIPTPEHYLPLLYVLALKNDDEEIEIFNDVTLAGSMSMTSLKIWSSTELRASLN